MSTDRCWSLLSDDARCPAPAAAASYFCSRHRHLNGTQVHNIWREPEAEMPPELVASMRRRLPDITFPVSKPRPPRASASTVPGPLEDDSQSSVSVLVADAGTADSDDRLDWLPTMLRAMMEEVMASEDPALKKASAIARLAGLYLKAYRVRDLEQANKELARRAAAAEARAAEMEALLVVQRDPPEAPVLEPASPVDAAPSCQVVFAPPAEEPQEGGGTVFTVLLDELSDDRPHTGLIPMSAAAHPDDRQSVSPVGSAPSPVGPARG